MKTAVQKTASLQPLVRAKCCDDAVFNLKNDELDNFRAQGVLKVAQCPRVAGRIKAGDRIFVDDQVVPQIVRIHRGVEHANVRADAN